MPEVAAERLVLCEDASVHCGERRCLSLLDAAGAHAHVRTLDRYHHPAGVRRLHYAISDLLRESLLHLQPTRHHVGHPRELGEAEHSMPRQVADVAATIEGQQVVLTQRVDPDVALRKHTMRHAAT